MSKNKLLEIFEKIKDIIGGDDIIEEMDNIYETTDVNELSKHDLESLIDYLKDEYVLDSELSELDDKSSFVGDLNIDDH